MVAMPQSSREFMESFDIRSVAEIDPQRISSFLERRWGSRLLVSRGKLHDAAALPGFFACHHERVIGLATYQLVDADCELVTLDSEVEGIGVGSALTAMVREAAIAADCRRLWLITTNDNANSNRKSRLLAWMVFPYTTKSNWKCG